VNPALELILWGFVVYLLWRILRAVSGEISSSRRPLPTQVPVNPTVSDEPGDEPYTVDDDPGEDGGSHIDLYPSQRKFVYEAWWVPGDREQEYEYRVDPDCHVMCRLRYAMQTGTKSGDGKFEDRFYHKLHTVRDGVVVEDAVRFIYEDNRFTNPSDEITELSAQTEWHEITPRSAWPGLWYNITKIHISEYEARRGTRKELERLKRGLRIITEQTNQSFTFEHNEKYKYSTFKPIDESAPEESRAILADAVERSGLTLNEAQVAHFQIRSLAELLGDATEGNHERGSK
jgi:hypothetical protein